MQVTELQMWSYLDGTLSEAEILEFELAIKNDSSLQVSFDKIVELHQSLLSMELEKTPAHLQSSIMDKIAKVKLSPVNSFSGFKYFVWSFIALNLFVMIGGYFFNTPTTTKTYKLDVLLADLYNKLPEFVTGFSFDVNMLYVIITIVLITWLTIVDLRSKNKLVKAISSK